MMKTLARGFTLLEMIVAIGIFSIIMLIVTGAYLTLIGLDREVRATTSLVTNLSFAVDSMARSIRTGTDYGCNSSGGAEGGTNGECLSFSFFDSTLNTKVTYIRKGNGTLGRCTGAGICSDSSAITLTDPNIIVPPNGLTFYVRGVGLSGANADVQPQVTFTIRGTMKASNGREADFAIQSSATQRLIEI